MLVIKNYYWIIFAKYLNFYYLFCCVLYFDFVYYKLKSTNQKVRKADAGGWAKEWPFSL